MIDRNGKFDVESFGRNSQGWYWMVWRPERLPGTFEAVAMKARVLVIELEVSTCKFRLFLLVESISHPFCWRVIDIRFANLTLVA